MIISTFIFLISMLIGCTNSKNREDLSFEGKSENWLVSLVIEKLESAGSDLMYTFFYIGEGPKPPVFYYEIDSKSPTFIPGEGSLEGQNEMGVSMVGDTYPIYKTTRIPISITWDGKKEELVVKGQ
jgi:hypothetical protein